MKSWSCQLKLCLTRTTAHSITPTSAVKGSGEQLTLEERSVTTGELTEGGIVITHGLTNGERVVAAGVNEIHAQQQVRIWTREGDCNGYLPTVY